MQQAKLRTWLVIVLAVLASASMFPSLGGSSPHRSAPPARHTTLVAKHQGDGSAEHPTPMRARP